MPKIHELKLALGDVVLIDEAIEGKVVYFDLGKWGDRAATADWENETELGVLIIQENGARVFHDLEYLQKDYCRFKVLRRRDF